MENVAAQTGVGTKPGQPLGSFIGGVFGLIYVEANAGVLVAPAATALRIAGAAAFAGLLALLAVNRGSGAPAAAAAQGGFGPRYWLVVAAEVAAIAAGSALLNGPLDRPAPWWPGLRRGRGALCRSGRGLAGVTFPVAGRGHCPVRPAGLAAAGLGAPSAVIATVGGVLPGALLLAVGYRGASALTVPRY